MSMPLLTLDTPSTVFGNSKSTSDYSPLSRMPQNSFSLTQQRSSLAFESVYEVLREHSEADWDGDDAKPVSREACAEALRFLTMLPLTIDMPELAAEPDGAIALEWYASPSCLFLASFRGRGIISYAGVFGKNMEIHGKEPFTDSIPRIIIENIQRALLQRRATSD